MKKQLNAKFHLGVIMSEPKILEHLTQIEILRALKRHVSGDWGDLCTSDKLSNDRTINDDGTVKTGERILSAFTAEDGTKFWVVTEAFYTALILPEEF